MDEVNVLREALVSLLSDYGALWEESRGHRCIYPVEFKKCFSDLMEQLSPAERRAVMAHIEREGRGL